MQRQLATFRRAFKARSCVPYGIALACLAISWWAHGCAELNGLKYNHPMLICQNGKVEESVNGALLHIALPQLPKRYVPISAAVSRSAFCVLARYTPPQTVEAYQPGSFSFDDGKDPPEKDCLLIVKRAGRPAVAFLNNLRGRDVVLSTRYVYIDQHLDDDSLYTNTGTPSRPSGLVIAVDLRTLAHTTISNSKSVRGTPGGKSVAILMNSGIVMVYHNLVPKGELPLPRNTSIPGRSWDYDSATGVLAALRSDLDPIRFYKGQTAIEVPVSQLIPMQGGFSIRLEPIVDNIWCEVDSDIAYSQIVVVSPNSSDLGTLPRVFHQFGPIADESFQPLSPVEVRFLHGMQKDLRDGMRRL